MVKTNELKAQMKRIGTTQEKLAKEIGINQATLNRKLNNVSGEKITVAEANRIAEALKFTRTELVGIFFAKELTETQECNKIAQ